MSEPRRFTPRSAAEWGAVAPTWLGIIGLVASFIVWAVTPAHLYEPVFISTFAGLLAVGAGARAIDTLRQPPPPPVPPSDPPGIADRDPTADERS